MKNEMIVVCPCGFAHDLDFEDAPDNNIRILQPCICGSKTLYIMSEQAYLNELSSTRMSTQEI